METKCRKLRQEKYKEEDAKEEIERRLTKTERKT
jgi:hypothetical protein